MITDAADTPEQTPTAQFRPAAPADLDGAARLLADAFDRYPWTRWSLPDEGYRQRLEEVQRLYLSYALDVGLVLVESQGRAVAAFLPPRPPAPSITVQHRVAELHGTRLEAVTGLSLPEPPADAWTVETVGVAPRSQGSGLGSGILAAGLAHIDRRGVPVALETSDVRNVRFYERLGFITSKVTRVPDGPEVYSMCRAATSTEGGPEQQASAAAPD